MFQSAWDIQCVVGISNLAFSAWSDTSLPAHAMYLSCRWLTTFIWLTAPLKILWNQTGNPLQWGLACPCEEAKGLTWSELNEPHQSH